MKFNVYCCSCTGNNQHYVKKMIQQFKQLDMSYSFEVFDINLLLNQLEENQKLQLAPCDGLVFSSYTDCYQLPPQVQKFINNIPDNFLKGKPTFTLNSNGGDPGVTALDFQDRLSSTLYYGNLSQKYVNNYYKLTYPKTKEEVETINPNYESILSLFLQQVHKQINMKSPISGLSLSQKAKLKSVRAILNLRPKFRQLAMIRSPLVVNQDKCVSCNICVDICPQQIIKTTDGKVSFSYEDKLFNDEKYINNCICCFNCVQNCPKQAITSKDRKLDKFIQYEFNEYQISIRKGFQLKSDLEADFKQQQSV
ncbi:4Fe-4S ferredoxin iron-sulfur binding domain protein [Spironucleus salmonicida]|uniref:4Fe-4S ferredoxin iron-sulfur binding domain protein n=1 Tax=Spironucleus salmonicida TaxID=348837 RepID=V6LKS0_9EUKA|nr:4Fe-4S ferredoxin iron-sulfur binding domain protein [Spironucleus salmonicida]|eukprot:EST44963.1 4Fe-4S ferredoxin iron-sulfur binding domain protein [Spironucleus salmonicida]